MYLVISRIAGKIMQINPAVWKSFQIQLSLFKYKKKMVVNWNYYILFSGMSAKKAENPWSNLYIYTHAVPVRISRKHRSSRMTKRLTLFREIIGPYCANSMRKTLNTAWQQEQFLNDTDD